jgi:hypothetical protein
MQEARSMNTFTASFSDGTIATRTSTRPYSHASLFRLVRPNGTKYQRTGFSTSEAQARRNMDRETYRAGARFNNRSKSGIEFAHRCGFHDQNLAANVSDSTFDGSQLHIAFEKGLGPAMRR